MTDRHPIQILKSTGAQQYSVSFQTESGHAKQWQSTLRSAHQKVPPAKTGWQEVVQLCAVVLLDEMKISIQSLNNA